ncbi:MAG: hypothetical protein WC831_05465 [Parcubacteria group bacterium]
MTEENKNKFGKNFLRAAAFSLAGLFVLIMGFSALEPAVSDAAQTTDSVVVNLNVLATISLNTPSDVTMAPDITGTGSSTGSTTWTVTTNNSAGWKLEVNTDQASTMHSGSDVFADYSETADGTPEAWLVAPSAAEFGFGATGSYVETKFGVDKYMGFNSTTKEQVSHNSAETAGDSTTVTFKAEVGSSKLQPTGAYASTVTATATTL